MKTLTPEEARALRIATASNLGLFPNGVEWEALRFIYEYHLVPQGYVHKTVYADLVNYAASSLGRDALMCYDFANLSIIGL